MPNKTDLTGQKFHRWTVIKEVQSEKPGSHWLCKCDCGKERIHCASILKSGITKSCGCLQKERARQSSLTHGLTYSKLYRVWNTMKYRCYNKNSKAYKNYGARGITICNEWKNNFLSFYNWAINNGYKEGLTIERKDVNGNYDPNNCCFATFIQQANNTRKNIFVIYNGEKLSISQWAKRIGIDRNTFVWRLNKYGLCEKVFAPVNSNCRNNLCRLQQIANKKK